jgi:outer membrane immunogenic protein
MTKILLGTTMLAGLLVAGVAQAADMPLKAPRVAAPVYNWTGCYLGAGGGYGMFNQENTLVTDPGHVALSGENTVGGRGWFGTVGGGCDLQIGERWVIGAFADYDFSDIHGHLVVPNIVPFSLTGTEKERSAWSVGGRIGYLINPSLLTYFAGGFTEARFSNTALVSNVPGTVFSPAVHLSGRTFDGWFLGAGYEYQLGWLPGLFWKTEYRFAQYDREFLPIIVDGTGRSFGEGLDSKKFVQTIRSELVWRFNWGGRY